MKKRFWYEAKRAVSLLLILVMLVSSAACGRKEGAAPAEVTDAAAEASKETESSEASSIEESSSDEASGTEGPASAPSVRPTLLDAKLFASEAEKVSASVPAYTVEKDFSNIMNYERLYLEPEWEKHLIDDGFFVLDGGGDEFFDVYEGNRYSMTPNFVTVDSLMHSYHLYFAYLLKKTEKKELMSRLKELTDIMLVSSEKQKEDMGASGEWETATDRNIAFFAVAKALLDDSYDPAKDKGVDRQALDIVKAELELINAASGITESPLTGGEEYEDYSQYKPKGYYDTDEELKKYFKAMMWYGRRNFNQDSDSMDRSAMLITAAMDDRAYELWSGIYAVTSFFAGASDDNGICEYRPLIEEAYGKSAAELKAKELADEKGWEKFHKLTESLKPPAINSVPMEDDNGETDKAEANTGFRFMGQRFSIDAAIFQRLIYSRVKENSKGETRLLPDALDVPAALGSETAEDILRRDLKAMDYEGYEENLKGLKEAMASAGDETWYASLYSEWLNTLRPLLEKKGEGWPMFMQNENWMKKSLEGFLGSYTELKHDTVLYSKQVIAEMGGGEEEEVDFRGYAEPEPVIYKRFSELAKGTKTGLDKFGLLDKETSEDLDKLSDIADRLKTIAEKELKDEKLSDDEYEFIEIYGGEIEHFWYQAYKDEAGEDGYVDPRMFPSPLVVDVATDPNGRVLELATGDVSTVFVIVPVDGTLRIAKGSVFNFYQFEQPLDSRMTDHEWRIRLGIDADDNGEFHWEQVDIPDKPAWTDSYRESYSY